MDLRERRQVAAWILGLALLSYASAASAQRVVIQDVTGSRPEAPVLGMLLRSMLKGPRHPAIPRRELYISLNKLGIDPSVLASGWTPATTAALKGLNADRLVRTDVVRNGDQLVVTYNTYSVTGDPTGAGSIVAPVGELPALALDVAKRLGADVGADVDPKPIASYAELRPYAAAADVRAGDQKGARAAARALVTADPSVAQRIPAAREAVEALRDEPSLPAANRMNAAMAAGDTAGAIVLASQAGPNDEARAQGALIKIANGDLAGAEADLRLAPVKNAGPLVTLARAQIEYQRRNDPKKLAKALQPLLARTPPEPAVLAYVATLPPGILGDKNEQLAFDAAKKSDPLQATQMARRMTKGGASPETVYGDAKLSEMSTEELTKMAKDLDAKSPLAEKVQAELTARKESPPRPYDPALDGTAAEKASAKRMATSLGKAGTAGKAEKKKQDGSDAAILGERLVNALDRFSVLRETPGTRVRIVAQKPPEPFMPRRRINYALLSDAFKHALQHDTFQCKPQLSANTQTDYILTYDAQIDDKVVKFNMVLTDAKGGNKSERQGFLDPGSTQLLQRNPWHSVFWALIALLATTLGPGSLFVLYRLFIRVGVVEVDVHNMLGSQRETFAIKVSRSPIGPRVTDADKFEKQQRAKGPNTGWRNRPMAAGKTVFHRIPLGRWYVHVRGTYTIDDNVSILNDLGREITVPRGGKVFANFDIRVSEATLPVRVFDGAMPVKDALVFIESLGNLARTSKEGVVQLKVPAGDYEVRVVVKKREVKKTVSVAPGTAPELFIDLKQPA